MEQHLQDLKCGGRPMNKNELRIKELEKENQQLKENNQNMQEEIKDLCKKFKVNERSRRKMQKSLMEKLQQKEDNINKAQEEIKLLLQENKKLRAQLESSEKARKEAIEHIKELYDNTDDTTCYDIDKVEKERLLQILDIDKGE